MDISGHKEPLRVHIQAKRLLFDALDIPLIFIFLKWMTFEFGLKKIGKSSFCEALEVSLPVKAEAGMEKTVDFPYP